jgi:ribokinase
MQESGVNVLGSANMDLIVRAERFPLPGETILGGDFATLPGGKGANQAVAIGRLGGEVRFIGCVGTDAFGEALADSLASAGVDTSGLQRRPEPTGVAVITVDQPGENTIVVASGANFHLDARLAVEFLQKHPARVLLCQLETPLSAIEAAVRAHEGLFVLNPAPARPLPLHLLERVDVLTPNETECALLTGSDPNAETTSRSLKMLLDAGVRNVVMTQGSRGCTWASSTGIHHFPAHAVVPVDTTAAGDAFSGALAHSLALGASIETAIAQAMAVAALSVTRKGAQQSMPTAAEVEAFLKTR